MVGHLVYYWPVEQVYYNISLYNEKGLKGFGGLIKGKFMVTFPTKLADFKDQVVYNYFE